MHLFRHRACGVVTEICFAALERDSIVGDGELVDRASTGDDAVDTQRKILAAGLGCLGIAAIAMYSNAGDLNPPAGPVAPTMVTLEELNASVQSLLQTVSEPEVWDFAIGSPGFVGDFGVVVPSGSGFLHAVYLDNSDLDPQYGGIIIALWDVTETELYGAVQADINASGKVVLNTRYTNGIKAVPVGQSLDQPFALVKALYRPDE